MSQLPARGWGNCVSGLPCRSPFSILTLNEEVNLDACLSSLSWCDDVAVLDSGSTDRTVELAIRHGARVVTRPFDDYAGQRNFGLSGIEDRHPWILMLDADERVPPTWSGRCARR